MTQNITSPQNPDELIAALQKLVEQPLNEASPQNLQEQAKILNKLFSSLLANTNMNFFYSDDFMKFRFALTAQSQFIRTYQLMRSIKQQDKTAEISKVTNELDKPCRNTGDSNAPLDA